MSRILLVEDDIQFATAISVSLRARAYQVTLAQTGIDALKRLSVDHFDIVILDIGLPDVDGIAVLVEIRKTSTIPVIVLSARHGELTKVDALDAGADDYITKPFGLGEFLARLRAALRRTAPPISHGQLAIGNLTVDLERRLLLDVDKQIIKLTPTEWGVLEVLVMESGRLVSRQDLLRRVWGPTYKKEFEYLRVYVAALRRKIEQDPSNPKYLITEVGVGYRLITQELPIKKQNLTKLDKT